MHIQGGQQFAPYSVMAWIRGRVHSSSLSDAFLETKRHKTLIPLKYVYPSDSLLDVGHVVALLHAA